MMLHREKNEENKETCEFEHKNMIDTIISCKVYQISLFKFAVETWKWRNLSQEQNISKNWISGSYHCDR